ncbi:MAG: HAD family phosphatase [Rhodospirillaceae bacterium]|jgi:HAD superfamily hydrolase (TIGR01509 family)|nr:HAD family phosphatase [Rhodospirillaceae bacterium]MBT6137902.1 HAD family phosphatase [Rhodospirillaceae bacterium]
MPLPTDTLVIFDCDGVLVDSEPIVFAVFVESLRPFGIELSVEEAVRRYKGHRLRENRQQLLRDYGIDMPESWEREQFQLGEDRLAVEVGAITGVAPVVERLVGRGNPVCVASQSRMTRIELSLKRADLWSHFEGNVFSAHMVEKAKPAPDVYLLAAKTMGHAPESCFVIEDTVAGVSAGVAAGMTVFGYAADSDPAALGQAGAVSIFDDMSELPGLLGI